MDLSLYPFVDVLPAPFDRSPAMVYLARLAPGSRRTMAQSLDRAAEILSGGEATGGTMPWSTVRYAHVQALRAQLAENLAPATANKILSAVRGVLQEAWRLGQMTAEEYRRASDVEAIKGETLPAGRALSRDELAQLFREIAQDRNVPLRARDTSLFAVLYSCGLRRAEVVALNLSDYTLDTGELRIVGGKGNKDRTVYATNGTAVALQAWLEVRGTDPGPLFLPVSQSGKVLRRRLSPSAIWDIVSHRAEQAGIKHFSPHSLRRTCVSDLLDAGADVSIVSKLMGHATIQTTMRYDRRPEIAKMHAAGMIAVPLAG